MKRLTRKRMIGTLGLLGVLSVGAVLCGLALGATDVSLLEVGRSVGGSLRSDGLGPTLRRMATVGSEGFADPGVRAVVAIRLPVVLLAFVVGSSLASAGTGLQAILRNPLADPFILGVSGGAAVGAAVAVVSGLAAQQASLASLLAFAGAAAAVVLVHLAAGRGRVPPERLLLTGFVFNLIASALVLLLVYVAAPARQGQIIAWMMGRIPQARASWLAVGTTTLLALVGLGILWYTARDLDLLAAGERAARTLGVDVPRTRGLVFLAASLVTGGAVALTGLIGFVGIIVPHAIRLAVGPDHRLLVPASFLAGGAFLCLADALARWVLAPQVVPVGVVTALVGGPAFIWLLRTRFRRGLL